MLAMTLRSYPYILAALLAMVMLATGLHWIGVEERIRRLRPQASLSAGGVVLVLATATFGILLYISRNVNQGMPHVPDEVSTCSRRRRSPRSA
jgi:hypothetical protein